MRRWERMREDVEFCLLENVRSYLRIPATGKSLDIKHFLSSHFAIDSIMTAKNQDALLFTAEHLFVTTF